MRSRTSSSCARTRRIPAATTASTRRSSARTPAGHLVRMDAPPTLPADQIQATYVTPHEPDRPLSRSAAAVRWHAARRAHERNARRRTTARARCRRRATHSASRRSSCRTARTRRHAAHERHSGEHLVLGSRRAGDVVRHDVGAAAGRSARAYAAVAARRAARRAGGAGLPRGRRRSGAFRRDLQGRNLAVVVSRNVTVRDRADKQQPYNLRVALLPAPRTHRRRTRTAKLYDLKYMQFFQADQVRGVGGTASPRAGRRVLARVMHDAVNPPTALPGSVKIAADGSIAAFVPARRALSWQTTDGAGTPVVRERYWLTFQPGEVRVCNSCHGVNSATSSTARLRKTPPRHCAHCCRPGRRSRRSLRSEERSRSDVVGCQLSVVCHSRPE
jgi:hypothetical protein